MLSWRANTKDVFPRMIYIFASAEIWIELRRMDSLPIKDSDVVVGEVGCLCAEYERIAFTAGLKLGAQLMMELAGETSVDQ